MDVDVSPLACVRILVVDDFQPFREIVAVTLRDRPELRIVGAASDGLEAVTKTTELRPDLVLLDIGLPGIDGLEAAKRIQEAVPVTKILFVSTYSNAVVVRAALSNGASGYVLKTDAATELLTAIEAVLQARKFVSSGISNRERTGCD